MPLSDIQAIDTRAAVSDMLNNRNEAEMSQVELDGLNFMRKDLAEYETDAGLRGVGAYQRDPKNDLDNIELYQGLHSGELDTSKHFGEDFINTPENIENTLYALYAPDAINKETGEVIEDIDSVKEMFMLRHNVNDAGLALKMDLEERKGLMETSNAINEFASNAAVNGTSASQAMSEFRESNPDMVEWGEDFTNQFNDVYYGSQNVYQANKESFDALTENLKNGVTRKDLGVDVMTATMILSDIPVDQQDAALRYAFQKIDGEGDALSLLAASATQQTIDFLGFDATDIRENKRQLSNAIASGEKVLVPHGGLSSARNDALGATLRVATARTEFSLFEGAKIGERGYLRAATPEETRQLHKDLHQAGKFARTLGKVHSFISGKHKDTSDMEEGLRKTIMDRMIYPSIEMTPLAVHFTLSMISSNKIVTAAKFTGKAHKWSARVMAHIMTNGSMKRDYFDNIMANDPNFDVGAAYAISNVAGHIGNGISLLSGSFQLSLIPGIGRLVNKTVAPQFAGNIVMRGIKGTLASAGAETLEELAQGGVLEGALKIASLQVTQDMFRIIDGKVPDINLGERLGKVLEGAPDIMMAMTPMALLVGGGNMLIKPEAARRTLGNTNLLRRSGVKSKTIKAIQKEPTIKGKIKILVDAGHSVDTIATAIASFVEEGGTVADLVAEEDAIAAKEAVDSEARSTRDEPIIAEVKKDGVNDGYTVQIGENKPEKHATLESAEARTAQWHEEHGAPPQTGEFDIHKPVNIKDVKTKGAIKVRREPGNEPKLEKALDLVEHSINKAIAKVEEAGVTIPMGMRQRLQGGDSYLINDLNQLIRDPSPENVQAMAEKYPVQETTNPSFEIEEEPNIDESAAEVETLTKDVSEKAEKIKQLEGELKDVKRAAVDTGVENTKRVKELETEIADLKADAKVLEEKIVEAEKRTAPKMDRVGEQTEPPNTKIVGTKHAKTVETLKRLGLEDMLPKKEVVTMENALEEVQNDEDYMSGVEGIVKRTLESPDTINTKEHAALLLHLADLEETIEAREAELDELSVNGTKSEVKNKAAEIRILELKLANASVASHLAGTELALSFRFRQVMMDRSTNTIAKIKRKAKAAGKGKIDPKIERELEEKTEELEKVNRQLQKVLKKQARSKAKGSEDRAAAAVNKVKVDRSIKPLAAGEKVGMDRVQAARERLNKRGRC